MSRRRWLFISLVVYSLSGCTHDWDRGDEDAAIDAQVDGEAPDDAGSDGSPSPSPQGEASIPAPDGARHLDGSDPDGKVPTLPSDGATDVDGSERDAEAAVPDADASSDASAAAACAALACKNGGTCVAGKCSCPPSWEGATCEKDVDECLGNHGCPSAFPCENLAGGYTCGGEMADFPLPRANAKRIASDFELANKSVLDKFTGLRWQAELWGADDPPNNSRKPVEWAAANQYCQDLVLEGFSDWRLPNYVEVETLYHGDTLNDFVAKEYFVPGLSNAGNLDNWTTSLIQNAGDPKVAASHAVYHYYAGWWGRPDPAVAWVRCVRRERTQCLVPPMKRFVGQGDTVHDTCTKLTWTKSPSTTLESHATQSAYCSGLSLAGRKWRLPSFLELASIIDPGLPNGVSPAFITPTGCYMSNTRMATDGASASPWYMVGREVQDLGWTEYQPKCFARCVSDPSP